MVKLNKIIKKKNKKKKDKIEEYNQFITPAGDNNSISSSRATDCKFVTFADLQEIMNNMQETF